MTSALDQKGLKPCPFCGGTAERVDIEDGDNAGGSFVHCTACDASGNVEFGFKENFISNWNRRAYLSTVIPAEIAGVVERLRNRGGQVLLDGGYSNPPEPDRLLLNAATLIERLAASQAETRRLALEEAAKVVRGRQDLYRKKQQKHDALAEGTVTEWDRIEHTIVALAYVLAEVRALIDQPTASGEDA